MRGLKAFWLGALAGSLALACGSPSSAPPAAAPSQAEHELTALQFFERKAQLSCEPGKEHWRTAGAPKRGGTFVKASGTALEHLDVTVPGGSNVMPQVYEHLLETRACFFEDAMMVPGLAKSWQVSPDGRTWTLQLREDVKWHDKPPVNGRPFTAADVGWTIDHQKAGGQLRSTWAPITYESRGPYTVVLHLPDPDADFLGNVIGERNNLILPREIKEQFGDFKTEAIGTGPYQVKSFASKQLEVLERTPNWREKGEDGQPLPYIDEIRIPFLDYTAEVAAMRTGQLDLNNTIGFLKPDADALRKANPKLVQYQDVAPIPRGLWMDLKKKPFDDARVRKAIFYATDSDEIVEGAYQGGALRTGHLPSAIGQYAWPPSKVRELYKPDLAKAKQLLAEAGYGPNNPLKFTMTKAVAPQDAGGEVVQQQLKAAGIDVQIDAPPGIGATIIASRNFYAVWSGVSPASIFPDRWMGGFLRCGDSRNYSNFCDPEVDRLSLAQSRELDPAKRKVILDQLQQKLYEEMPWVPSLSLIYYRQQACRVRNMPPTDYTQQLTGIGRAWLDPTGC